MLSIFVFKDFILKYAIHVRGWGISYAHVSAGAQEGHKRVSGPRGLELQVLCDGSVRS